MKRSFPIRVSGVFRSQVSRAPERGSTFLESFGNYLEATRTSSRVYAGVYFIGRQVGLSGLFHFSRSLSLRDLSAGIITNLPLSGVAHVRMYI